MTETHTGGTGPRFSYLRYSVVIKWLYRVRDKRPCQLVSYLSVQQEAHQPISEALQVPDRGPAFTELSLQEALPVSAQLQCSRDDAKGCLPVTQTQLQPAVSHQARAIAITVQRVGHQQQSLPQANERKFMG